MTFPVRYCADVGLVPLFVSSSQPAPVVRSPPSSIPLRGGPSVGGWAAPVRGAAGPHRAARCSPHGLNCGPRGPGEHGLPGRTWTSCRRRTEALQGHARPGQLQLAEEKGCAQSTELWAAPLRISAGPRLDVAYWLPLAESWMAALHRQTDGFRFTSFNLCLEDTSYHSASVSALLVSDH